MAHYTPQTLSQAFSHDELLRQFILCKDLLIIPIGWEYRAMGEYWFGWHEELPLTSIEFSEVGMTGYMLGYVIDPVTQEYNTPRIDQHVTQKTGFDAVEEYLYRLGGRFLCIVSDGITTRMYHDASGSLSMVYSAEQEIAASTSMLIPYHNGDIDDDIQLIEQFRLDEKSGVYPFTLTPRKKIKRLLPNHYLNLDTWATVRHWPNQSFTIRSDIDVLAREIGEVMKNTITTILDEGFNPYMSLTAGVDSRALLACAYSRRDALKFFTWELPDTIAQLDITVADEIATKHGLDYEVYPYLPAKQEDVDKWLYRTALSVGEQRGKDLTTTIAGMDSSKPYLAGNVSEVSRGVFWRDGEDDVLTAEILIKRLNAPMGASIMEASDEWLQKIPKEISHRDTLDLLFLEQKIGGWAGEIAHGHACGPFHIFPFSNRKIFDLMLSSPNEIEYRKSKGIIKKIIEELQPDLMDWDFNAGKVRA